MGLKAKIHMSSLTDSFEFILIASLLGLVSDVYWCLSDIIHNGVSLNYVIILSGLIGATSCTFKAFYEHHKKVFKLKIKELIDTKKLIQKKKQAKKIKR